MKEILLFEGRLFKKSWGFYVMLLAFFALGLLTAEAANFPFPDVHRNSPYIISYVIALFSQISIFSVTILAAQVLLREKDANFQQVLYSTPVKKNELLVSRFLLIAGIATLLFLMLVAGLMAGHSLSAANSDDTGPFRLWYYIQPFLLFGLPNTVLCAGVICLAGWLSKNKLMIYLSGLLIYVLYIVVSIFSNSPLMATASPVSNESMAIAARIDPFGLAALYEQTRYWAPVDRNTRLIAFSGAVLINRVVWIIASLVFLLIGILSFRFSAANKRGRKKTEPAFKEGAAAQQFKPVPAHTGTRAHRLQTIVSFIKIDLKSIVKSIPFTLVCLAWVFLLGMEIYGTIEGGIRLPQRYVTTGLMVNTILKTIPFFCLMAILFYSNDIVWRSRNANIAALENSTATPGSPVLIAKLISLSVIPLLFVLLSIATGIAFQLMYQYPVIDMGLYFSLFGLVFLPMVCCLAIVMSIQVFIKNKYAGIAAAAAFVLLTNTSIGQMAGLKNPLFRIGNSYEKLYSEMSGYGAYLQPFSWMLLYAASIAVLFILFAGKIWSTNKRSSFKQYFSGKSSLAFAAAAVPAFLISASHIFYHNNILHPKNSASEQYQWMQDYEQAYRKYASMPQPIINVVQTQIDLYPAEHRYKVKGSYWLQNKTAAPMDSLLLYFTNESEEQTLQVSNATLVLQDKKFGHYSYRFNKPLAPQDSFKINFSFSYHWSGFKGHRSFNAIVENGSFMRISNFFPVTGYQPDNEIEDERARSKRGLGKATLLPEPEDSTGSNYFITLDMQLSTAGDQTAIGVGELVKQWSANGRNYFHYNTGQAIPFRFAVSSAAYAIKKDSYNGKPLEIYYHPAHSENIDSAIAGAKRTLAYCEKNFGPYPFHSIRFAEISSFTKGIAGTAYPAVIFMTEDMVFHTNNSHSKTVNAIGELTSHELAHQWWGGNQLQPANKKGRSVITETLAMYTELMLNKQVADSAAILRSVKMYKEMYFSEAGFSKESVLYKAGPGEIFLNYYKGVVVMYQLQLMLGEEKINLVLKNLLAKHIYPLQPAGTSDLINELKAVSDPQQQVVVDEMFKQVITHELKINSTSVKQLNGQYELAFDVTVSKFSRVNENKVQVPMNSNVDVAVYVGNSKQVFALPVVNNKISGKLLLKAKPTLLEVDPYIKLMDAFDEDNSKELK